MFCGAGGTTTGVEQAELNGQACAKVIACVNHDVNAIASHQANHPDTLHFTEDIRTLDLTELTIHLNRMRVKYPNALVVLWASLECTNFSKAKGGRLVMLIAGHLQNIFSAISSNSTLIIFKLRM